jgi:hypothetical protein
MGPILTPREQLRRIASAFKPGLKNRYPVPRYVRISMLTYVCIITAVLIISTIFHANPAFRDSYTHTVFLVNKPVTKVTANVLGYSMDRSGGRRSPSRFSYEYGFTYAVGGQTYYGTGYAARDEPGDYRAYIPLPRTTDITVNSNNPKQFSYITAHYGLGSYVNFGVAVYIIWLGVLCVTSFGIGLREGPQFAKFDDYIPLFSGIIISVLPVYYAVTANIEIYNGDVARNVTGYSIVHKNTKSFSNAYRNASQISAEYDYGNDKGKAYSLQGMRDTQIHKIFIKSLDGKERNLEFEYTHNNKHITIYQPEGLYIQNEVVYAMSNTGKYAIPLAILEYDFDYKGIF